MGSLMPEVQKTIVSVEPTKYYIKNYKLHNYDLYKKEETSTKWEFCKFNFLHRISFSKSVKTISR